MPTVNEEETNVGSGSVTKAHHHQPTHVKPYHPQNAGVRRALWKLPTQLIKNNLSSRIHEDKIQNEHPILWVQTEMARFANATEPIRRA